MARTYCVALCADAGLTSLSFSMSDSAPKLFYSVTVRGSSPSLPPSPFSDSSPSCGWCESNYTRSRTFETETSRASAPNCPKKSTKIVAQAGALYLFPAANRGVKFEQRQKCNLHSATTRDFTIGKRQDGLTTIGIA